MAEEHLPGVGRVIACRERRSPEYRPEKVNLPVREASFVQVGRGEHAVDVQIATVGEVCLSRLGIEVESVGINVLNPDYAGIVLPLSWTGDFHINGCAVQKSSIYMAGTLDTIHLRSKSRETIGVTFPKAPFVRAIAALRGVDVDDIALKERELRLSEIVAKTVRARFAAIINTACGDNAAISSEALSRDVLELLIDAYLHALPEPEIHPGRLYRPERIVRRAEEHFMASTAEPLSLADLCAATGVKKSSLYKAFDTVCGQTPLSYFYKRRLMQSRSLLLKSDDERGGVKRSAISCGFTELGRFSVQYRQLFGESPSVTLSRDED